MIFVLSQTSWGVENINSSAVLQHLLQCSTKSGFADVLLKLLFLCSFQLARLVSERRNTAKHGKSKTQIVKPLELRVAEEPVIEVIILGLVLPQ